MLTVYQPKGDKKVTNIALKQTFLKKIKKFFEKMQF